MRGDLSAICRVLREKDRFLIACHENPEGDAIGSELALALALRKMGKTATVLNADPVPANLLFLPGAGTVVFAEDGTKYDVAVVVDPADYDALLAELEANGGATMLATRRRLAQKLAARRRLARREQSDATRADGATRRRG